jgi:arsenate reductase (thioredoxin)
MRIELDPARQAQLDRGVFVLAVEFRGIFSRETIARCVSESFETLPAARFAPGSALRFARERLRALGQAEWMIAKDVPEVLFVCERNSGPSQIAAALLHQRAAGLVRARSAGPDPADQIAQIVVRAMVEVGLDLSHEFPKPLTDEVVRAADVVVTLGRGDVLPTFPGKRYEGWAIDDPGGRALEEVRAIRTEIDRHVRGLLTTVAAEPGRSALG